MSILQAQSFNIVKNQYWVIAVKKVIQVIFGSSAWPICWSSSTTNTKCQMICKGHKQTNSLARLSQLLYLKVKPKVSASIMSLMIPYCT